MFTPYSIIPNIRLPDWGMSLKLKKDSNLRYCQLKKILFWTLHIIRRLEWLWQPWLPTVCTTLPERLWQECKQKPTTVLRARSFIVRPIQSKESPDNLDQPERGTHPFTKGLSRREKQARFVEKYGRSSLEAATNIETCSWPWFNRIKFKATLTTCYRSRWRWPGTCYWGWHKAQ